MAVLCQLADPEHYKAFPWSLIADPRDLAYWLGLFESFPEQIHQYLCEDGLTGPNFEARWGAFRAEYQAGIDAIRAHPELDGGVTTLSLVYFRQRLLKEHGWPDPYVKVKHRANDAAARLYPQVIREVDTAPAASRYPMLLKGVFAGNMFDLGAPATIEMFGNGGLDYPAMLAKTPDRPWFVDHADAFIQNLQNRRYHQALIFVDNAGTDIVLGVLPLAREIARGGVRVVLAANSEPALNDITIDELNTLLEQLSDVDPILNGLRMRGELRTVSSGNGTPLIDLSQVSEPCNAAAAESDLIVLEGMGRGVESNWGQRFRCDALHLALIKDESVARWVRCDLFDAVCRLNASAQ